MHINAGFVLGVRHIKFGFNLSRLRLLEKKIVQDNSTAILNFKGLEDRTCPVLPEERSSPRRAIVPSSIAKDPSPFICFFPFFFKWGCEIII